MKTIDPSKIKILVCCHKQCELPEDEMFLPIHVGAALSDKNLGIQRDDQLNGESCDNISSKNRSFCELTAIYWAWKNLLKIYPDTEYVGLNHYRRYFEYDKERTRDKLVLKTSEVKDYKINHSKMFKYLSEGYTIIPKRKVYPYSLTLDYCNCHLSEDYRVLKETVKELYPAYDAAFCSIFDENNKLSHYNMSIMRVKDFMDYCQWMFDILFKVESKIDISNYNPVQKRIFGYMSERLFNVWLYHNQTKIKEVPIVLYSDDWENEKHYRKNNRHNMKCFNNFIPLKIRIRNKLLDSENGKKLLYKFQNR